MAAVLSGMYGVCNRSGTPRILSPWFHRHYGTIMGFVTCMTGFGAAFFTDMFQKTEATFGWRNAYRLASVSCMVVALLVLIFIRNKPADMGVKPYGEGELTKNAKKSTRDHWEGYEAKEVLRKPTFWLMMVVVFFSCICTYAAYSVLVPTSRIAACPLMTPPLCRVFCC